MCTDYPDIFAALAAPFAKGEVKTRSQGGKNLSYITARTAMNRLDEVLGPENWSDEYFEGREGLKCRLTITLPNGVKVSKEDGGAGAGMSDQDNDEKSAFSSAFKRACVKFGVGRYLYQDGTARFALSAPTPPPPAAPQVNGNGHKVKDAWGSPGDRKPASLPPPKAASTPPRTPTDSPQALFYNQLTMVQKTHRNGRGVVAHVLEWGKGQGLPALVKDWPELRLVDAQEVARTYLLGVTAEAN